ncbi:hypothetical protein [Goodfellowiella coeruleoviolacea]|uniref:Uncharacterized protein n=1 Tax=Goodfellowiella coeruleoviolacea TaxID=334858 RepID=A0AAE3GHF4_9PSEU|nr:hypothetical protein [Goodfellowiella coeruleoviolacea]MCP2167439.1 hypothetical protein [Goodfellowiella coeruleoviolacea]
MSPETGEVAAQVVVRVPPTDAVMPNISWALSSAEPVALPCVVNVLAFVTEFVVAVSLVLALSTPPSPCCSCW